MKIGQLHALAPLPDGHVLEIYLDGVGWERVEQLWGTVTFQSAGARYTFPADMRCSVRATCEHITVTKLDDHHVGWWYSREGVEWQVLHDLVYDSGLRRVGLVDGEGSTEWVPFRDGIWVRPPVAVEGV